VSLRAGTRDDIPALAELVLACDRSQRSWAGDVPVPSLAEEALEWELRFARTAAWIGVAEDAGGRITGAVAFAAAGATRGSRELVPGLAHISAVFVHPDFWRRGIARSLLDAAETAMRDAGFERAQLWTLHGSPAENLYRALGWERDGRRDHYPPMGLDTIAYVKALGPPRP
jgi:ribosomal protein S18 acetylase RimI-like enzyme